LQLVVVAAGQAPAPLQLAVAVAIPPAQLAVRQDVVVAASAQAPPAAQAPVFPHSVPVVQRESVTPAVVGAQVPLVPPVFAAEQALQAVVQALLQQKPSAQNPEAHWLAAVHAVPLALQVPPAQPTHKPPVHCVPVAQLALVTHDVVHALAPQMNGEQFAVATAGQAPVPVQLAAKVAMPLAQLAVRHDVVDDASAQAPPAAQAPVFPHSVPVVQRESVVPVVVAPQVPLAPPVFAAEHALHAVVQALLQQKPSAQNPDVHWLAALHEPPFAFLATQAVAEQKSPAMQSVSAAQVILHAGDPHTNGAQLLVAAVGHAPAPLQLAAAVAMPLVQLAVRHDVVDDARAQTPPTAHAPVLPHTEPVMQRESVVPAVMAAQVPLVPPVFAAEHALHAVVQALLQQNPSAQNPDVH
jgi:hypothetical protein